MLLYTKVINGERKIYASATGVPATTDSEVVYKDADGDTISLVANDTYVDAGSHGVMRLSDSKFVAVYAGDTNVIPGGDYTPAAKVLKEIKIIKKPTKLSYIVGDSFDTTGLKVQAIYEKDKEYVEAITSPANEYVFEDSDVSAAKEVTVSYTEGSVTKSATFTIEVHAAE